MQFNLRRTDISGKLKLSTIAFDLLDPARISARKLEVIMDEKVEILTDQVKKMLQDINNGASAGTVAASKAVIYSYAGGIAVYPSIEAFAHAPLVTKIFVA